MPGGGQKAPKVTGKGTSSTKLSKGILRKMASILKKEIVKEAKKDFAKMGMETRDLEKKFNVTVTPQGELLIESEVFIDMEGEGRRKGPLSWLTQENKKISADKFALTLAEKTLRSRGDREARKLLIVPIKDKKTGKVVFRTAPLHVGSAWVHPGIARGAFLQTAIDKAMAKMEEVLGEEESPMSDLMFEDMSLWL